MPMKKVNFWIFYNVMCNRSYFYGAGFLVLIDLQDSYNIPFVLWRST